MGFPGSAEELEAGQILGPVGVGREVDVGMGDLILALGGFIEWQRIC